MTDQEFLKLVDNGVEALGEEVLKRIKNVAIVLADKPTSEQLEETDLDEEGVLFGLYEGVPLSERGLEDKFRLPDKITIFKNAILDTCSEPQDIVECIENTIWHEVAHHFGWDEEWIEKEEKIRGKTR